ncbi:hypothetical protein [Streptomyces racemochromogenes]|uniref:hypothetical protein n=1 Tax=Streptomyces racemochromogenes TaxID=67353 RepID=UPI0031EBB308
MTAIHQRALEAVDNALEERGYWLPIEGRNAVAEAIADYCQAELDAAQRRTVRFVERIGDARAWARTLPAEQQHQLLTILAGRETRHV